ncbi:VOC family protein [Chitinophaga sp. 212800008-4]|uniref:VOC family protein n=1 Tax=unclassified Chitinophaga TaxID=2619133 RepID=UPI0030D293B8
MFSKTPTFSSFSVNSLSEAKTFYHDVLGIETDDREHMINLKLADGKNILVYEKPDHAPATFTVLNFVVDDVDAAVDQLNAQGIVMLQYGGPIATDAKGIHRGEGGETIAWFADPAGNILSVLKSSML